MGRLQTPVLLIVNSSAEHAHDVASTMQALTAVVSPHDLRVIAPTAYAGRVEGAGVAREHIRPATVHGAELELNFFLEHAHAFEWVARQRPRTVLGTAPHSLYNEEVKDLFESRVLMFLGSATFLAHALPARFVYELTAADLIERTQRPARVAAYRALSDAVLADFHAQWLAKGSPSQDDSPDYRDVEDTFARHLGREVLTYDEQSPVPTPIATSAPRELAAQVRRTRVQQLIRQVRARFS